MVIIMLGVPGSGKSTHAKALQLPIVSADDAFVGDDGVYRFNPADLPKAHASCLRRFVELVQHGMDVVVDNTNTSVAEIAPYAALAQAYGHELRLLRVECDPEVAATRNVHGVPAETVRAMHARLAATVKLLPPWWPLETIS